VPLTVRYGDHPSQHADLHLPGGSARELPVAVVIHGGFWQAGYGAELGAPLAADLAARGWAAWNLEYRRVGGGGGWPATLADVAAGIDALAGAGQRAAHGRLDLARVAAVGHSAGGHLALWAASRPTLPAGTVGAAPRVRLAGAVSQAGVTDLALAAEQRLGDGAVLTLLGGTPAEWPERYRVASPIARLPAGVPVTLVHGTADAQVPIEQSRRYADAARTAGDPVTLTELAGVDHFALIDSRSSAWAVCQRHLGEFR
jgi:acetyl esterase/lipase